jgi:signal transduction histidine kinase
MDVPGSTSTWEGGAAAAHPPVALRRLGPTRAPAPTRARLALGGIAGFVLAAGSVAVALSSGTRPGALVALNALSVALPIAVGLVAWRRTTTTGFGLLLAALGAAYFLVTLSTSRVDIVYSVGRVAGFVVSLLIVYVILAFPTGRLESRPARAIVAAMVLVLVALYLPLVPLTKSFPAPFPWGGCDAGCPSNAFFAGTEPGFVDAARSVRELLTVVLFASAAVVVAARIRAASRLERRMLVPVLGAGAVWLVAIAALFVGRRWSVDPVVDGASWLLLAAIPMLALGFLAGMLHWRLYAGTALPRLVRTLASYPASTDLRDALADALGDPTLEVLYRLPGRGYADAQGQLAALPREGALRSVSPVESRGERIAAIVHDPALRLEPELVEAAISAAQLVLEHHRLEVDLRASVREVRASQVRILLAADTERERIERDLHDGAQQRLVALRMKLELLPDRSGEPDPRAATLQRSLTEDVEAALQEIRELAHGIYPPLLASHGLGEALGAVAARCPIPTSVHVPGGRRFSREVESTVYFCCREALQNVSKHAPTARKVSIDLSADHDVLRFAITDDGDGFDVARHVQGAGLTHMRDRLAVVGGELDLRSRLGEGTSVNGSMPVE